MKILVVEDSPLHQEAAHILLSGHDVTVIDSFTSFCEKVTPIRSNVPEHCKPAELDLASFDAVLTDVNLPSHHSKEAATGFVVALQALAAGVKRVGIITDANHHLDSYGRAFDLPFTSVKVNDVGWGKRIVVGEARVAVECYYATTDIGGGRYGKNWKRLLDILSAD